MSNSNPVMVKEAADMLGVGSRKLFAILREEGVIGKLNNLPRKDLVDSGYFAVEIRSFRKFKNDQSYGRDIQYPVTLVTSTGLSFINDILERRQESAAS